MNKCGMRPIFSAPYLTACAVLLLFVSPALCADKSKPASAPKPASTPKSSGAKPSGGAAAGHSTGTGAGASHGTTTASHSPTTAGHSTSTTTAGHSTSTTTAGHSTSNTTAGHTTSNTTAGHTTGNTTAGHNTPAASHTNTTPGAKSPAPTKNTNTNKPATSTTKQPVAKNSGYAGGKTPNGAKTVKTKNGGTVTKRADGKVATVHDTKRGMDVHHGLNGNRRVVVERQDHSRVVAERGRRGYVQRPYMYHGHEYARRSYYYHGRYYNRYYGRYYYRGVYVEPYYPSYYFAPAYYGWVYNPWVTPVAFGWGWAGNPWYGFYGAAYFAPYPTYAGASFWLTDYLISNSLQAAYQAQVDANIQAAALNGAAPMSADVKGLIADEVKRQIALENTEQKTAGQNNEPDAASSSIQRALTDGVQHVFIAGHDLDVVDAGGNECAISEGDALQLATGNAADATSINLVVLSNKGGKECPKGDTVAVALQDLQDMQNHMRETVDQGMQELQKKQGSGGLPPAPASAKTPPVETVVATNAPPAPPEKEVAAEIDQQSKEADSAEKEAAANETTEPAKDTDGAANTDAPPPAEAPTVSIGQSIDDVTAALGNPKNIVDLGAKKIYVYKDMKVVFNNGKVTDVQ